MQGTAALTELSRGYMPLAPGREVDFRSGMEGLPFTGQGGVASLAAMAMAPGLHRAMGEVGMTPMGLGHDQNVFDVFRMMQFSQMQMRTTQEAAEADRASFMTSFRGLAAVTGTPWGAAQRRAASALSSAAVAAAPILSMVMPEYLDQMGGSRGSATVMARHMVDAGRYRIDPVTGRMGMSSETVGQQAQALFRDLYSDPNIADMQGITAGRLGDLYRELQSRGMLRTHAAEAAPPGSRFRAGDFRGQASRALESLSAEGPDAVAAVARRQGVDVSRGLQGLSGGDLDKLMADPDVSGKLRAFDTARVKQSLQSYVGAIAAMRDIFGDNGHPDAPIRQLIAGLEAMTLGATATIDPGRLGMLVRQTHNLARQTGTTLDNALVLQQHAAARAADLGLEPIFGVQAMQGALGFGGAYRAQGHGAFTAWGAMNSDQVTQMDANLRVQAASSNMANRLNAAMRLRDAVGGFQAGSEMHGFTQAIAAGMDQFRDAEGRLRPLQVNGREFVRMLSGARGARGEALHITEGDTYDLLDQTEANREFGSRYQTEAIVRRAQGPGELYPFVGNRMQEVLQARLRSELARRGVAPAEAAERARDAASRVSPEATRRMFATSSEEFSDRSRRNRGIAEALGEGLAGTGEAALLESMAPEERESFLTGTAERFYGHANQSIPASAFAAFGNLQNIHRLNNRTVLDEADRQQMRARHSSMIEEALAPLGHGTILARAVDALRRARPGDSQAALRVLGQSLGGVRTDDINRALLGPMRRLAEQSAAVEALQEKVAGEEDPGRRGDLATQLDGAHRELRGFSEQVVQAGERFGMFADAGVDPEVIDRVLAGGRSVSRTAGDLAAVRTGAAQHVTDAEIRRLMGSSGPGAPAEAEAVLRARRAATPAMTDAEARTQFASLGRNLEVRSPEEARALALLRRRLAGAVPAEHEVRGVMDRYGDAIAQGEAEDLVAARNRATRLGIAPEDVERATGLSPDALRRPGAWRQERATIDRLVDGQREAQFAVTSEQRAAYVREYLGGKEPSEEQREAFRRANPGFAGDAKAEMLDRLVRGERRKGVRARFDAFWAGEDGARFAEEVESAGDDYEDVAHRLIGTPQMTRRLGTRAVTMSRSLGANQRRLRDLASLHAGNNLARLVGGDLDIDATTDEGHRRALAVQDEARALLEEQRAIVEELRDQQGREGRQWQLGDRGVAAERVLAEEVGAGRLTPDQAARYRASLLNADQQRLVDASRRGLGGEAELRRLAGVPEGADVTAWQRAKLDALRLGAGNAGEVRAALGAAPDVRLDPTVVATARSGAGSMAEAFALLRRFNPNLDANDEETKERAHAIAIGLAKDEHALDLAPALRDLPPDQQRAAVRSIRLGRGSEEFSRERLGMGPAPTDPRSADVTRRIGERRELMGNYAEALELTGHRGTLTDAQRAEVERLANVVGAARRVGEEHQGLLDSFRQRELALVGFGTRQGSTPAELDRFLGMAGAGGALSAAQRESLAAAPLDVAAGDLDSVQAGRDAIHAAESRRDAARHALDQALAELDAPGLTPERRAELTARVAVLRRDVAQAEAGVAAGHEGLRGAAGRAGSTTTELVAGRRSGSKLEGLSPEQAARRDALSGRLPDLDRKIAAAAASRREGEAGRLVAERARALAGVAPDAAARGVTPEEYLKGAGFTTEATRLAYAQLARDQKGTAGELAKLGLKPGDVAALDDLGRRRDARQAEALRLDREAPLDLVRALYKSYDQDLPAGALNKTQQELVARVGAGADHGLGRRILEARESLGRRAAAGGDADVRHLAEAYAGATDRSKGQAAFTEAVRDFQRRHGFSLDRDGRPTREGREEWGRFEHDVELLKHHKLLDPGKSGGRFDEALLRAYTSGTGEGVLAKRAVTDSGEMKISGQLTGDFTIKGDRGHTVADFGGSSRYPATPL